MYKDLARTPAMNVSFHVRHSLNAGGGGHSLRSLLPCPIHIEMADHHSWRSNTRTHFAAAIVGCWWDRPAGAVNTATIVRAACIPGTWTTVRRAIAPAPAGLR